MTTTGALALTETITRVLDELAISYVVGGSIASSVVGEPRATLDVDIVGGREVPRPVISSENLRPGQRR